MIVGVFDPNALGAYLRRAADRLGLEPISLDAKQAIGPRNPLTRAYARLVPVRPSRMAAFSRSVLETASATRPRWCLMTGRAPVSPATIREMSRMGIRLLNFSTDDPWNPRGRAPWHLEALQYHNAIFTPRSANVRQLMDTGCRHVELLHFGYDPDVHRSATPEEVAGERRAADVVFIGGADRERLPFALALKRAGLHVALYGGYWDSYWNTRALHGGFLDLSEMRTVLARAKTSVCLVRRANRDQHVMRTYEEPAMGSCIAMEDTDHHRSIFSDPAAVPSFFRTPDELVRCVRGLCEDAELRERVRALQRRAVIEGKHTYLDRLRTMLSATD